MSRYGAPVELPSPQQAMAFALMLKAGLPAGEAIIYFFPDAEPPELKEALRRWQTCGEVKKATLALMGGKAWHELSLEEQMETALTYHYAALAHFLFVNNYADLAPQDRTKADTARAAIEAKIAGTAGKVDELSQFFADVRSGKVKLPSARAAQATEPVN